MGLANIFQPVIGCSIKQGIAFSTSNYLYREIPNTLKGRKKSSQEWLTRQLTDPYIEKAKIANYRCRSAFKLLEIDDKYHVLSAGQCVVDCGAAPGSWTQVIVQRINALGKDIKKPVGKVIAVDRLPIFPIAGAISLDNTDFTAPSTQAKLNELLEDKKVDVVVSDMAPNATGLHSMDHENIMHLTYCALRFSLKVSVVGASFLVKILDGSETPGLERDLSRFYSRIKVVKPAASRSDSTETFLLARGFKGLK